MKILHINEWDIEGGATRAMLRLHNGLLDLGEESVILVKQKTSADDSIMNVNHTFVGTAINKSYQHYIRAIRGIPKGSIDATFLPMTIKDGLMQKINEIKPDIINVHWISEGFVRIETLGKIDLPIVWTLHDMWPFTGGCHYDNYCGKYRTECGHCPFLRSSKEHDLSMSIFHRKRKTYRNTQNLTIVTPSNWLATAASESKLFSDRQIKIIPNGIDTNIFKPIDKKIARNLLNIPADKKIILFGAVGVLSDERKGAKYLFEALNKIRNNNNVALAVLGAANRTGRITNFNTYYFGKLCDDLSLILLYSAADVTVVPSTQENLANVIIESLACGTPVVAFDIGGNKDMINHQVNGYLAAPYKTIELADGIEWFISGKKRHDNVATIAKKTIEDKFTSKIMSQQYLACYKKILSQI